MVTVKPPSAPEPVGELIGACRPAVSGFFVTGTGTEVGKTAVTAALAHAWASRGIDVGVMKPVATGCRRRNEVLRCEDVEALAAAAGVADPADLLCPYRFEPPVAPLVALSNGAGISLQRIERAYRRLSRRHACMLVEGIGGLEVPLDGRRTVLDLAERLGLPLIIVADAGLGTLNHTLLTLRAARQRGLTVAGVILNRRQPRPSLAERTNPEVLRRLGGVPILGVVPRLRNPSPPNIARHLSLPEGPAPQGPQRGLPPKGGKGARSDLRRRRLARIDRRHIWHPFTQMADWQKEEPLIIESARGVWLRDTRGRRYLDGVSSLWVNLHGHRHPALDAALKRQIDRVAHSTLLGAGNVPSVELAEALVRIAPKGLTRVFYSDNGSTAVEVALKMAFQFWRQNGAPRRRRFLHFQQAYHGDTIGSVSVGGIALFHEIYRPLLFQGIRVPVDLEAVERALRKNAGRVAAVVVEPLVQGASGMLLQPEGWLKGLERLCRKHDLFFIADEVAVGFGRTGRMFACEWEGVRPDFLCLAKGLTGGYLPLAATLTTERVYRGFLGSYASKRTFFHGHSYTGNPLGCAVALENLKIFQRERVLARLQPKIRLFEEELAAFEALPHVGEVRRRGFLAGVELVADKTKGRPYPWEARMGARVCRHLRSRGVLLRPLGNVIVLMPPLSISRDELRFLCRQTRAAIEAVTGP